MSEEVKEQVSKVRVFPNDFEAEQCLLGCIITDGDVASDVVPSIDEEYFYNPRHKRIFAACAKLFHQGVNIDAVTVNDRIEEDKNSDINMFAYLSDICNMLASSANYQNYVKILADKMVRRKVITACNGIIKEAYDGDNAQDLVAMAERDIYKISEKYQRGDLTHISKASAMLIDRMNKMCTDKSHFKGLMTHYPILDQITNGLQRSDLIILAARPSVGKTSFALNIVSNIIDAEETDKAIAVFSLEMSSVQLAQRLFSNMTDVTMNQLSRGVQNENIQSTLWSANAKMGKSTVYVDETAMISPAEVLSKCRRLRGIINKPLDLIVIDYLQLMKSDSKRRDESRSNEVGDMSRTLKLIAKELDCPVIVLSQMSRSIESRDDKTPKLSDLRESGSIEQDADIVFFLSRENENERGKPNYNVVLSIAKHRNGELHDIKYYWTGANVKFTEAPSDDQEIHFVQAVKKPSSKFSDGSGD